MEKVASHDNDPARNNDEMPQEQLMSSEIEQNLLNDIEKRKVVSVLESCRSHLDIDQHDKTTRYVVYTVILLIGVVILVYGIYVFV